MNWAEMIQMRRHKESLANSTHLSFRPGEYQYAVEISGQLLQPHHRIAIRLRFWEGLTIARVADRLGMSWSGADALIDEALGALYGHLRAWKQERQSNHFGQMAS